MWKRVTLRSAFAALTPFVLAGSMLLFLVFGVFWTDQAVETLLTYELLLVHAFAFLMVPMAATPKLWAGKLVRFVCFWGLFAAYCAVAFGEDGWWGIGTLAGMGLATYGGLFFTPIESESYRQVGSRWMVALLAMFVSGIVAGICVGSEVYGDPVYGVVFFSIVGAAELFRAHDLHAERERAGTAEPAS